MVHMSSISDNGRRFFISIGLLVFVSGGTLAAPATTNEPPVVYSPIPAVDCVINPYRVADLASPVPGVIDRLNVERSQQVSAGEVVAQMDAGVERASVELAEYRAGIQSEINLGQINLDYDKRRQQRVGSLYEKKVISVENTDEAEREANLSRWKLQQAVELANVRKLELQRAREQLRQKSIRAPFDGFVLDTFKYRGEYVEDQAILRLAQLDPLVVEAIVPMDNFGQINPGMTAEIVPDFVSDQKLKARVTIVDRIGDTASNTFGVRLVLPNPENRLPAGLKCVAKFLQQTDEPPLPVTTAEPVDEQATASGSANDHMPAGGVSDDTVVAQIHQETRPVNYLVVTARSETKSQVRELFNRLKEAGVNDLQEAYQGFYDGCILLGLFSKRDNAERRLQSLAELGFTAFIHEQY